MSEYVKHNELEIGKFYEPEGCGYGDNIFKPIYWHIDGSLSAIMLRNDKCENFCKEELENSLFEEFTEKNALTIALKRLEETQKNLQENKYYYHQREVDAWSQSNTMNIKSIIKRLKEIG